MVARRGVVFDMDDTLYLERDYVRSGFCAVAQHVHQEVGCGGQRALEILWSDFESGIRGEAFDRLLEQLGVHEHQISVSSLVAKYREHNPQISLPSDALALLDDLKVRRVPMGVITDGPLASQQAKAKALGLAHHTQSIVFTDLWGRAFWKPHQRAFEQMSIDLEVAGKQLVYVADNPAKDFVAPHELGWTTVQLCLVGQVHSELPPTQPADHVVNSFAELRTFLLAWVDGHGARPHSR